jgi:hypothetical protein
MRCVFFGKSILKYFRKGIIVHFGPLFCEILFLRQNFKKGTSERREFCFLEMGHIGYTKILNFMLIKKCQLSDKMCKFRNETIGLARFFPLKTVF